jgi:hypothetical protein
MDELRTVAEAFRQSYTEHLNSCSRCTAAWEKLRDVLDALPVEQPAQAQQQFFASTQVAQEHGFGPVQRGSEAE